MKKREKRRMQGISGLWYKLLVLIVMGFLIQFFISDIYNISIAVSLLISLVFVAVSFYYWGKGFFNFLLFVLTSLSLFVVLEMSFDLWLSLNFAISLLFAYLLSLFYLKWKSNESFALILLFAFAVVWIINGFNVLDRTDWVLENAINIPFIVILIFISKWFRFSKTSYGLFYIYMFMNIIGSHYTYSEVPFGYWLQGFFGLERNHYDRIIHFLFGFLLAYPMREVYVRVGNYKGFWALGAPIIMVFGLSCVYELIEWGIVVIFASDLGVAYLGTQGDVWDAQKDMFLAGVGSIITMGVVFVVLMGLKAKEYLKELKDSFRVHRGELGEVAIAKMIRK